MEEQESLGKYFKRERESQKISLKEVAENTKVREHILRAIEEDQHDLLPSFTYVKGFLLSYARFLRLDANKVLSLYQKRGLEEEPVPLPPKRPPKRILWNKKQTWVVGGIIVASLVGFYFFSPYLFKTSLKPAPEKPVVEEKLLPTPSPSLAETSSIPGEKPLSLQLKAIEETWVSLQVNGQSEKEMTLKPGENISVEASDRIRMIVGNAGGLDLILNGESMEKFGKSGEVITLIFTSQGVEVKRPEKTNRP